MDNFKKFFIGPKIIFLVLGIAILIEAIYAVKVLTAPIPAPPPFSTSNDNVQLSGGSILLNTGKTNIALGETVSIKVLIATGGHILDGADVIMRFDPKIFEASQTGLIKGRIFDEYPLVSINSNSGVVSVSGVNSLKNGFKGTGQFMSLNLKAKAKGKSVVTVDYQQNSTSDSNLVEANTSRDILESVGRLELNVQ